MDSIILSYSLAAIVFFLVLVSSFIHASIGFGFSVLLMTVMPLFIPLLSTSVIVKVSMLIITLLMTIQLRKYVDLRFIVLPTICMLIGNTIGFFLLINLETTVLKNILGYFLVGLGIVSLILKNGFPIKKSKGADILFGFLAGITGGLFNLSGVVLVLYYYSALDNKLEYSSSMQASFTITATYGALLHGMNGNFSDSNLISLIGISILAVLIGTFLGMKVLMRISKDLIGKLSYVYMILMGLLMIFKFNFV